MNPLVADEAHNLLERGRAMYSATLHSAAWRSKSPRLSMEKKQHRVRLMLQLPCLARGSWQISMRQP